MKAYTIVITFLLISTETINSSYLDMTYELHHDIPTHPIVHPFELTLLNNETQPGGFWMQLEEVCTSVHIGTHMDAPCHFAKGKWCINEIPFDHLICPAVVVDITEKAEKERDATVSIEDLENWEKNYGKIPDGAVIIVRSGWGKLWSDPEKYMGNTQAQPTKLHSPGMSIEAAYWLLNNTKINALGSETLSVDRGSSVVYEVHTILYNANVYGLENLANVDKLPVKGATIYAMPINIREGSGAPARVFAQIPD